MQYSPMPYRAFLGSETLKQQMMGPVRSRWAQGEIYPLPYLKWRTDGGMVSIAGALAQTQDPDEFVTTTGLPLELGVLCEGLVFSSVEFREDKDAALGFSMQGRPELLDFALQWLEAIKVGSDLSTVVPRFMQGFLASVLAPDFGLASHFDQPTLEARERILANWSREFAGEVVSAREWRVVRTEALGACEGAEDPWGHAVAELVESLAWPVHSLVHEFAPILQIFIKSWKDFIALPHLGDEDRQILLAAARGNRELARAQRDPAYASVPSEQLLEHLPEARQAILTAMQPQIVARIAAGRQQAEADLARAVRPQMDFLLSLIDKHAGNRPAS